MKKKHGLLSLFLSILLLFSLAVPAAATEINNSTPYIDDEVYIFPIQPGSAEWLSFTSKQEKLDVCQIPEKKLSVMTTDALLETVLNYPLIHDYLAFNTLNEALETMSSDFNGLRALLARKDFTGTLLNEYSKANVMTSYQLDLQDCTEMSKESIDQFFLTQTLEFLVSCDQMENGAYSVDEQKLFEKELNEKEASRSNSGLYSDFSDIYQEYQSEKADLCSVKLMAGESYSTGYVYTPNGTTVTTLLNRSPEYTQSEILAINNSVANSYPNATFYSNASVKYNCHSYAWYQQSANIHWINYPSSYMTDGSYTRYLGTPSVGMKAYYYNGDHSGVVANVSNGTIYIRSKWGPAGVYQHYLNDCPYTPGTYFYTR